jgi:hypothetical protein
VKDYQHCHIKILPAWLVVVGTNVGDVKRSGVHVVLSISFIVDCGAVDFTLVTKLYQSNVILLCH